MTTRSQRVQCEGTPETRGDGGRGGLATLTNAELDDGMLLQHPHIR
ncbi:MAG: hypothetical protein OXI80_17645 [Caldilineaceae bacterium]|nr:hypothetical protein [Caldilineaceae bacterium]